LEETLVSQVKSQSASGIILKPDPSVPLEEVVKVMDIANRNSFKCVLTKSK